MLTLYGFKGSRSMRIAWLLEELNVPYDFKLAEASDLAKGLFPEGIKKNSPTGESPCIKTEDGQLLVESGFIVSYIMDKYGKGSKLQPRNAEEEQAVQLALYTAEANIMTVGIALLTHKTAVSQAPIGAAFLLAQLFKYIDSFYSTPKLHQLLQALEQQIKANQGYLVGGHLTAADIMYEYDVSFFEEKAVVEYKNYPVLASYLKELHARPAYQKALEKHNGTPNC